MLRKAILWRKHPNFGQVNFLGDFVLVLILQSLLANAFKVLSEQVITLLDLTNAILSTCNPVDGALL